MLICLFEKFSSLLLLFVLLTSVASAETLGHYMFRAGASWNVVKGEICLLPVVNTTKIDKTHHQMNIEVTERGGVAGTIDKILIHVFDDEFLSEDIVFDSRIITRTIGANETLELSEVMEIEQGQWVGYELVVGEKSFLGICKCSKSETITSDEEDIESKDERIEIKRAENDEDHEEVEDENDAEELVKVRDADEDKSEEIEVREKPGKEADESEGLEDMEIEYQNDTESWE